MKKLILLVIALLCFPVLTLANEGKGPCELDGEWYVSVINPDNVLDATIDDEGNYHIFDMNAGETEELIIKQSGTYELEGYEYKFSISHFGDATFFYIDNNGLSGMGVLLPNDKDEEKRCRFYYFYDVTRVLLMNGKLYGYQGEDGIFDEGTEYDYYTDGRNIYFIEGNTYRSGNITEYDDDLFVVDGIEDVGSVVFIRKADDLFVSAPESAANPPVKILDDYFDAVTRLDRETIQKICNIDIYEGPNFEYFVRWLGFTPGFLSNVDFLRVSDDLWAAYLSGMGYEGSVDEMMSAYAEDIKGDGEVIFSGFKASYKLLDLKPADDCKVQFQSGLKKIEVPDLKEKIKEDRQLDEVDEAYIAKIKIYWEYKGFPYGNDERLWDLSELSGVDTYETITEKNEDMDYYAFIYRVGDEWFLYHDSIIRNSYIFTIDMG